MSLRRPNRRTVITAAAVSAAAVITMAGTSVYAAHREVIVEVDGVTLPVEGFFTDVAGALSASGIELGEHDKVAPNQDTSLSGGETIVVRTANEYQMTIDGESITAWSTARNVNDVLGDLSSRGTTVAMPADRSSERSEIPLQAAAGSLQVIADGKTVTVEAPAGAGVEEILTLAGVSVSPIDRVAFMQVDGQLSLTVTRVVRGLYNETEVLAYTTEEREDADLYVGESSVVQEGKDGSIVRSFYRELIDGRQIINVQQSEKRTEPVTQITAKGTKERSATEQVSQATSASSQTASTNAESTTSTVSGDVWAALAQCESGGNPTTNTGNGYYGLYQFSLSTWQAVGGTGLPSQASAAEQTLRAQILQQRAGWGQWPACAAKLGLY